MAKGPVLVVAAHPDDEVLGAGGSMARWASEGRDVHVQFLADGETSRPMSAGEAEEAIGRRQTAARAALDSLGVASVVFSEHPDNALDRVGELEVARLVDAAVQRTGPELVVTHWSGDVNVDHRMAHRAVAVATRPLPGTSVRTVLCFESPSSTEWRLAGSGSTFEPSWFVDVSEHLEAKWEAIAAYGAEMRTFPHPRSKEALHALATWRGASCGVAAAEAFVVGRHVEPSDH